ncbi:hypothetical protein [Salarchaeum japonicum]|uniref:DUF5518 domain-containing protein n=1 Tax=Salarchaeum japonicum TaxID=555573 RepID=A0AAV3T4W9_9EURY|nr:hypothetical protein [Salarchaeum japonicum]
MSGMTVHRRVADRRAIAAGALVQAFALAALYLLVAPYYLYGIAPIAVGAFVGVISRAFETEGVDGAAAVGLGSFLGVFVVGIIFWLNSPFTVTQTVDILFVYGAWTTFGVICFAPIAALMGGVTAQVIAGYGGRAL